MNRLEANIPAKFRYVITRSEHKCEGCHNIIPKGSIALNVSGRIAFRFFNEYFCMMCDIDRIDSIPDGELRKLLYNTRNRRTRLRKTCGGKVELKRIKIQ